MNRPLNCCLLNLYRHAVIDLPFVKLCKKEGDDDSSDINEGIKGYVLSISAENYHMNT